MLGLTLTVGGLQAGGPAGIEQRLLYLPDGREFGVFSRSSSEQYGEGTSVSIRGAKAVRGGQLMLVLEPAINRPPATA
jgi:hypothetical protein